jgi:hypothetical protein
MAGAILMLRFPQRANQGNQVSFAKLRTFNLYTDSPDHPTVGKGWGKTIVPAPNQVENRPFDYPGR